MSKSSDVGYERDMGWVLCCMSMMKNPMNCWSTLSWDDQVLVIGCRVVFLRVPALVKFFWKSLWYWLRGMVMTEMLGSTLMARGLLP